MLLLFSKSNRRYLSKKCAQQGRTLVYESLGIRLGATKKASNPIDWTLTKVARNRITCATLYKICFLGLGQERHYMQ